MAQEMVRINEPFGTTTDSPANVYVADSSNNCIQKSSMLRTFLTKWAQWSGDGEFNGPLTSPPTLRQCICDHYV